MTQIRPMLAASFEDAELVDLELAMMSVTFPVMASPKIDGIRFMKPPLDQAKSRSWKNLPNEFIQQFFNLWAEHLEYLDGEIIVGADPAAPGLFNRTQSAVMSRGGTPEFSIHVFDSFAEPEQPFRRRTGIAQVKSTMLSLDVPCVNYVEHVTLHNAAEVIAYEAEALLNGYEGIMLRSPNGTYKYGRSTIKQQGLIKIKRFVDDEATVTGFVALERNTNPKLPDAFGLAKRSSHRAGKIADNLLGKLLVKHPTYGDFAIGSGFDVATREEIWLNQVKYLGKLVTFKFQPHGTKDAPRSPIFKGFRNVIDT